MALKWGEKGQSDGAEGVQARHSPVCRREIGGLLPSWLIKAGRGWDRTELWLSLCQTAEEKKSQEEKKTVEKQPVEENHLKEPQNSTINSKENTKKVWMRGKIPVLMGRLPHPDVFKGGKGDFELPPHLMNSREEIYACLGLRIFVLDLKMFCNGGSWWLFASHLPVTIQPGDLGEKQHGSCFYLHLGDFLTFSPLLLINLLL